jgi:hypothetical protein
MATIRNGVLGLMSGRIGSMVFYNINGKQMVRSLPRKSNRKPTEAQLAQQMRITLISSYFSRITYLIGKGYGGSNKCISYHLKNALTGVYPHLTIDQSKVVLTKGRLECPSNATLSCLGKHTLNLTWGNSGYFWQDDEVILIIYNEKQGVHNVMRTAVTRAIGIVNLTVPTSFSGQIVHCWLTFISRDGKQFSNSSYLGEVTIS